MSFNREFYILSFFFKIRNICNSASIWDSLTFFWPSDLEKCMSCKASKNVDLLNIYRNTDFEIIMTFERYLQWRRKAPAFWAKNSFIPIYCCVYRLFTSLVLSLKSVHLLLIFSLHHLIYSNYVFSNFSTFLRYISYPHINTIIFIRPTDSPTLLSSST